MKKVQQGFTLIELMIVVAIIGILAAVAIPAYQDYTVRAKLTEVMSMASSAKTSISEYYTSVGKMPADADAAGMNTSPSQSTYVSLIEYGTTGDTNATAEYTVDNLISDADGEKVIFTGTGSNNGIQWTCSAGGVPDKYMPANCR